MMELLRESLMEITILDKKGDKPLIEKIKELQARLKQTLLEKRESELEKTWI